MNYVRLTYLFWIAVTVLKLAGAVVFGIPKSLGLHAYSQDKMQIEMSRRAGDAASLFGSAMRLTKNRIGFADFKHCEFHSLNRAWISLSILRRSDVCPSPLHKFWVKTIWFKPMSKRAFVKGGATPIRL
jgi:hypothetical protein